MEELILEHGSYWAIICLLAGTGAGLPIPEEVIVVAAGVLSSPESNSLSPLLAVASCVLGTVIGDCFMYGIGRGLGDRFLRHSRWFKRVLSSQREERISELVQQHGFKVFLLARFLVGMRSPVYLVMGVMRIAFWKFVLRDAIAAACAVNVFFWLSYFLGSWIGPLVRKSQLALTGLILAAVCLAGLYLLCMKKIRKRFNLEDSSNTDANSQNPA